MDRLFLLASTLCFLLAVVRSIWAIRAEVFRPTPFNFFAIAAGFVLQTVFLWMRGQEVGRCPITSLFEVFIFMAWSIALVYMIVGSAYRLSLMGAFTAPLVLAIQAFALFALQDQPAAARVPVNAWLEFHASMSIVAYGSFALACVAGLMYLVQERQLKRRQLHSVFHHLPPLADLYAAITRLLWVGFGLYTAGLVAGFFTGEPLPWLKMSVAIGVWVFYAVILQGRHLLRFAPRHVAALCVIAFSSAVAMLWGITFMTERLPNS
ncbi:c-type cytochrome biogenesis protein CcsB [soil metagenome]